jgi:hypothetical protein
MPSIKTITILDGAATPVSHAFTPQRITKDEVAEFRERLVGPLIAQPEMKLQLKEQKANGLNVVDLRISVPTVTNVVGANGVSVPTVVYSESVFCSFKLPQQGVTAGRANIRMLLSNALKNADVIAVIDNGEALIGA